MLCSRFQIVKSGVSHDDVCVLPCRAWTCEWCQPKRRAQLMALAASGEPNKILTLTVNPHYLDSPAERRASLTDAWKKLVKRILRFTGEKKLAYMWFVEKTKRGEPHLHILLRCGFIEQDWLSDQMRDLIGAPIVDIRAIHNVRQAIRYVTKYVTKAPARWGNSKRYFASANYSLRPVEDDQVCDYDPKTMVIQRMPWADYIGDRQSQGFTIEKQENGWYKVWKPGWQDPSDEDRYWSWCRARHGF